MLAKPAASQPASHHIHTLAHVMYALASAAKCIGTGRNKRPLGDRSSLSLWFLLLYPSSINPLSLSVCVEESKSRAMYSDFNLLCMLFLDLKDFLYIYAYYIMYTILRKLYYFQELSLSDECI